jgi:hypothetical protein
VQGLTTSQFINRTSLPALFSMDTAEDMIDFYLDTLQGPWVADVYLAKPLIWSTLDSPLQAGIWYSAAAVWKSGNVPSADLLEQRLKSAGYNVYSHQKGVKPFYYKGHPLGLSFLVYTGNKPTRVRDIMKAAGADALVVNLAAPMDDPTLSETDKMLEVGDEMLSSFTDLGVGIGEATTGISEGTGTIVDVMGFVGKYFLPIGLAVGAGYLFYRHRKKKGRSYDPYGEYLYD